MIWWCWTIPGTRYRPMTPSCCWRRSAPPIPRCAARCSRCSAPSISRRCAKPTFAPPAMTAPRRPTRWRAGCGKKSRSGRSCRGLEEEPGLQSVDHPGVDQQPVEPAGFGAAPAGVKYAPAAQHDVLLLLERRIERDAGGFLNHQRQVGAVDRVHHGGTLHRFEIDGIDRVIGRIIARVIILQLLADAGLIETGIEQMRRELRLVIAIAHDQKWLPRKALLQPRHERGVIAGADRLPAQIFVDHGPVAGRPP